MSSVLEDLDVPHHTPPSVRRPVCFVAWGAVAGRSKEIAQAVGGEAKCFFAPGSGRRPPVLVRYVLASLATVAYLLRRRPKVVVVTNPPIFAALVAYCCARLIGAAVVVDSHPGGFGVQGDRVAARLQAVHRWMIRRSALVLVTGETWADQVRAWGGTAAIVHEAPGDWNCPAPIRHDRLRVLFAARFAADEDPEAVVGAARQLPDCDFTLTGDVERCPVAVRESAPENVTFVGFLDATDYRAAVVASDVVLSLSTEPTSVMRAAYEAVYARRPLVVSDWPIDRELFPFALHAANDQAGLTAAIRSLAADYGRYAASLEAARELQLERWDAQHRALVEAIDRLTD
jgi:Glycosyl transferase 4-like domain